jgi:hypothetical protein
MTEVNEVPQNNSPINNPNDIQNIEGLLGLVSSEPVNTPLKFWDSVKLDTAGNLWVNINNIWRMFKPYKENKIIASTCFEDYARLLVSTGGGSPSASVGNTGFIFATGATALSYINAKYNLFPDSAFKIFNDDPYFSCVLHCEDLDADESAEASAVVGLGGATITGTALTFNAPFVGFNILKEEGISTLYAVVSNGSNSSSVLLTTVSTNDNLELFFKVSSSSVTFNYRKNGIMGSPANINTYYPTDSSSNSVAMMTTNKATDFSHNFIISSIYYEK